ncbi:MAG: hypothetical protein ACE15D_16400 [Candidatus Eisenbacteria bacterium]|nr:hypothetical protein [Candidatus Eisenbacteria bacterium]
MRSKTATKKATTSKAPRITNARKRALQDADDIAEARAEEAQQAAAVHVPAEIANEAEKVFAARRAKTKKAITGTPPDAPDADKIEAQPITEAPTPVPPEEEVCVFAFRLTKAERDTIHAAAGRAKASRFVRTVSLAAAQGDVERIREIIEKGC